MAPFGGGIWFNFPVFPHFGPKGVCPHWATLARVLGAYERALNIFNPLCVNFLSAFHFLPALGKFSWGTRFCSGPFFWSATPRKILPKEGGLPGAFDPRRLRGTHCDQSHPSKWPPRGPPKTRLLGSHQHATTSFWGASPTQIGRANTIGGRIARAC